MEEYLDTILNTIDKFFIISGKDPGMTMIILAGIFYFTDKFTKHFNKEKYKNYTWLKNFGKKFLLRTYINYTLQQELLSKSIRILYKNVQEKYKKQIPDWLLKEYRKLNKPLLKYGNILTTNTRMIILFITIFYADVLYYFLFELIILNILLVYFVLKHEKTSKQLIEYTSNHTEAA